MAPKEVDVDPDGTDSETDSKPSESQVPSAPPLEESKSNQVASTPPADPKLNIQQQEEIASAREVSEETAPILMSTEASGISNALFAEEEINHSSVEDVDPENPSSLALLLTILQKQTRYSTFLSFLLESYLLFFSPLFWGDVLSSFCYSTDFCLFF